MSLLVSSIVGCVNEQKSTVTNVRAYDWTAELAIIASNVCFSLKTQITVSYTCTDLITVFLHYVV